MPITVAEGTRVLRAYGIQAKRETTRARQSILGDTAVSQRGKEIHMARRALEALPEMREDRIATIRKKLAEGQNISADAIAEKMIFQAVADRLR